MNPRAPSLAAACYPRAVLAKITGLTVVMITGLVAALIGGITLAIDGLSLHGLVLIGLGPAIGLACIAAIVRLNRRYQDEARAAVLADPAAIVARWGSGSDERILAERGLFIGRDFHPFASGYQTLVGARMVDDRVLELEFDILGADGTHRRAVDVPPAALPAVREFLARRR